MKALQELLEQQWVRRDGSPDYKMADYCLKNSVYVQLGDSFIDVGDSKPRIESQMWYDDETDGPDASQFEAFRAYNMRGKRFQLNDNQKFICAQYYGDKTDGKLLSFTIDDRKPGTRPATEQEIAAANEALAAVKQDYEKRLAMYWKRYSNKVHASGYWANR